MKVKRKELVGQNSSHMIWVSLQANQVLGQIASLESFLINPISCPLFIYCHDYFLFLHFLYSIFAIISLSQEWSSNNLIRTLEWIYCIPEEQAFYWPMPQLFHFFLFNKENDNGNLTCYPLMIQILISQFGIMVKS